MAALNVTTDQLEREFVRVFADGVDVPEKLWVESFHEYASFLRAVYPKEFSGRAADKLLELRAVLLDLYGPADMVVVVMFEDRDWEYWAAHRLVIHLAG